MRILIYLTVLLLSISVSSCGKSTKQKVQESEMKSKSEVRTKIREEYQSCISKADGDADKIKDCESLLKAADKVK